MISSISVFIALLAPPRPLLQPVAGCVPDDKATGWFIENVRFNMGRRPAGAWHHLVFTDADIANVTSVQDDSLCDKAFKTIRAWLTDSAYWPRGIRLLSAGNYYVAQALGNPGGTGEFLPQYFLDRTLTGVYFPCRDGQACGH